MLLFSNSHNHPHSYYRMMILITPIHVQYDSFAARSLPPASFKQSQPWASRFERAEGEGGEEAGAGHGGDDGGGNCGDHGGGHGGRQCLLDMVVVLVTMMMVMMAVVIIVVILAGINHDYDGGG